MVLFKKNPAMQKLKELTGGLIYTEYYENKLKKAGLTIRDGYEIQEEIKQSIKNHDLEAEGVETRLNYLIEQRKKAKNGSVHTPKKAKKPNEEIRDKDAENKAKLVSLIKNSDLDTSFKLLLEKDVNEGHIKDKDNLMAKIDEINIALTQKDSTEKKVQEEAENASMESPSSIKSLEDNGYEVKTITPDELAKMQKEDKVKEIKFRLNQEQNLLKCPRCGTDFLKGDKFCYSCGLDILQFIKDLNAGKIHISDDEPEPVNQENNESEQVTQEKSDVKVSKKSSPSKQKPAVKASTLRAINLKFASVVFLNEKNLKPTKLVKDDYFKTRYNTRLAKIKKYVKEEGYAVDGGPLITARDSNVSDLKKVLKKHSLRVSGTKEELIKRLGENLSEEELKKAFPKKSLEVTEKGREFIEKNIYVLYYDQTSQLRKLMPVEEYDSLFEDASDLDEEKIINLIEMHLNERENL